MAEEKFIIDYIEGAGRGIKNIFAVATGSRWKANIQKRAEAEGVSDAYSAEVVKDGIFYGMILGVLPVGLLVNSSVYRVTDNIGLAVFSQLGVTALCMALGNALGNMTNQSSVDQAIAKKKARATPSNRPSA